MQIGRTPWLTDIPLTFWNVVIYLECFSQVNTFLAATGPNVSTLSIFVRAPGHRAAFTGRCTLMLWE